MKNISKLLILITIILQVSVYPVKSEYFLDESHNFEIYKGRHEYKLGFPIPFVLATHIESCTTSIYLETDFIALGLVYDFIWLLIAINILEKWWPVND
ncbi:MAG: hypothetical protein ACW99F_03840 [Candidatus Hodarchaeales archaeon]|jgi:hypothetical protein